MTMTVVADHAAMPTYNDSTNLKIYNKWYQKCRVLPINQMMNERNAQNLYIGMFFPLWIAVINLLSNLL